MILALVLQAAAPQSAPPPGPATSAAVPTMVVEPVAMALAGWDADRDARITRAEATAGVRASFAPMGDKPIGYIAFADWAERWLGDRNALPSPFDVDSDADDRITLAELEAIFTRTFDRLDHDHDGTLTRAELLTIRAQAGDTPRGKRGRGGDGPPPQR